MDSSFINDQWWALGKLLCIFLVTLPMMIFSTTSTRVFAELGLARARYLVDEGHKKFEPFVNAPNDYWMTIHIIEVVSVVGMFCSGYLFMSHPGIELQTWAIWLILAGFYFVFHTALGSRLSRGDDRVLAERHLTLIKPFYFCLRPLTWLLIRILKPFAKQPEQKFANAERIEEELEVMLDESTRQGGLENIKGRIMRSAIDYSETTVREVMVPRTDLTACPVEYSLDEALDLFMKEGYSRLPVYEGNIDTIVGVLYYKDVVQKFIDLRNDDRARSQISLQTLVREAFFVPETNHIDAIFEDFKREHIHIAIVVDEFGGTAGLVTLEDIVEEFFGDIQDEYDTEDEAIIPLDSENKTVLVDARTSISEIGEHFDVELEENPDYESVGGLITYKLGHVGAVGEEIDEAGLHFVVREANERCILQVEISNLHAETDDSP